ncbi:MAG: type II secretion system F family protein [Candidatus Dormibacteria bacterium]
MTLAVLTFVFIVSVVMVTYWILVVRPERKFAGRLRDRVEVKTRKTIGSESIVKGKARGAQRPGPIGMLVAWHRRYAVAATARLIDSAGVRTDPQWLIGGTAIALLFVQLVLQLAHAGPAIRLLAGAATPLIPYFYIQYLARKRLRGFEEAFPEAISLMARALRAGHALTATLQMVAEEMDDPVHSEFQALYEQHSRGLPMTQVMRTFAARIPLVDVRFFSTAVLTQRETGGNLAEVLDNLANVMRDRFRVRNQLKVLTAQGRMSGWMLGGLPIVLGAALYFMNPGSFETFVTDPTGLWLLKIAITLEIVGVVAIHNILKVEY